MYTRGPKKVSRAITGMRRGEARRRRPLRRVRQGAVHYPGRTDSKKETIIMGVNWYRLSIENIACKAVMSEGTV